MNTIALRSDDIHCESCAASVRKALSAVDGVKNIKVDIDDKTVIVEFEDPAETQAIEAAMIEAGFLINK